MIYILYSCLQYTKVDNILDNVSRLYTQYIHWYLLLIIIKIIIIMFMFAKETRADSSIYTTIYFIKHLNWNKYRFFFSLHRLLNIQFNFKQYQPIDGEKTNEVTSHSELSIDYGARKSPKPFAMIKKLHEVKRRTTCNANGDVGIWLFSIKVDGKEQWNSWLNWAHYQKRGDHSPQTEKAKLILEPKATLNSS